RFVSPAIAETTTTIWCPRACHFATRRATFLMRSADPTEVPPYFWTISDICHAVTRKNLVFYGTFRGRTSRSRHVFCWSTMPAACLPRFFSNFMNLSHSSRSTQLLKQGLLHT